MAIYSKADIPTTVDRTEMDPQVKAFLKTGPVLGAHEPIHIQRAAHDAFIDENKPPIGKVEHMVLPGPHGSVPVRCFRASKDGPAKGAALVYMHGGGYIVGSLDQFDTAMRLFCENSGADVYAVDYKLAPEYQFPVQIEEGEFVIRWLIEHAAEQGIDPSRVAIGGDSAGGNMTCVIAQKLRDEKGPKLALQMPIYPEAGLPFATKAGVENRSGSYVDTAGVFLFAWSYIPQGVDYSQPYIIPLNAKSFSELPPALVVTCGFDMLRDVAHEYAQKLAAAGNNITYVHYDDLPHAFIQMTQHSGRCLEATLELSRLLGERLKSGNR